VKAAQPALNVETNSTDKRRNRPVTLALGIQYPKTLETLAFKKLAYRLHTVVTHFQSGRLGEVSESAGQRLVRPQP
jgi:hypothetical protein